MKRINILFPCISIVVSIIAVCIAVSSTAYSDVDFFGWIVAVLSTLVLTLIGWNIYQLVDIKEIEYKFNNDIEKLKKEYDLKIAAGVIRIGESASHDFNKALFEMHARNPSISDRPEPLIRYGLLFLESAVSLDRREAAYIVLKVYADCIKGRIELNSTEKGIINSILNRIDKMPSSSTIVEYHQIKEHLKGHVL